MLNWDEDIKPTSPSRIARDSSASRAAASLATVTGTAHHVGATSRD